MPKRFESQAVTKWLEPKGARAWNTYRRSLDAVAIGRKNPTISMSKAARRAGTTLKTVQRYAGQALETRGRHVYVRPTDRLARDLEFLTPKGLIVVRVMNSRDGTRIAKHNNAVRRWVNSRDASGLKKFEGKVLRAGGKTYPFLTDTAAIDRLARAYAIHFLDIYAATGGE